MPKSRKPKSPAPMGEPNATKSECPADSSLLDESERGEWQRDIMARYLPSEPWHPKAFALLISPPHTEEERLLIGLSLSNAKAQALQHKGSTVELVWDWNFDTSDPGDDPWAVAARQNNLERPKGKHIERWFKTHHKVEAAIKSGDLPTTADGMLASKEDALRWAKDEGFALPCHWAQQIRADLLEIEEAIRKALFETVSEIIWAQKQLPPPATPDTERDALEMAISGISIAKGEMTGLCHCYEWEIRDSPHVFLELGLARRCLVEAQHGLSFVSPVDPPERERWFLARETINAALKDLPELLDVATLLDDGKSTQVIRTLSMTPPRLCVPSANGGLSARVFDALRTATCDWVGLHGDPLNSAKNTAQFLLDSRRPSLVTDANSLMTASKEAEDLPRDPEALRAFEVDPQTPVVPGESPADSKEVPPGWIRHNAAKERVVKEMDGTVTKSHAGKMLTMEHKEGRINTWRKPGGTALYLDSNAVDAFILRLRNKALKEE